MSYVRRNCEPQGWTDHEGTPQEPDTINLYTVVDKVVIPSTKSRRCSFVELVAVLAQPPAWFVSHWWGEAVVAFLKCLRQHSQDRDLPRSTNYWVCAYANNQWNLDVDMGSDPQHSSFRRAMRIARGTVSVLDPNATCYTRIWCIFEIFISIGDLSALRPDYLYDVYTVDADPMYGDEGHEARGITDGLAAVDISGAKSARQKRHRELRFPWELQEKALSIKLQTAAASRDGDRAEILNFIAGAKDVSAPPPVEHPRYDMLNEVLHGRFAAASWVKAVDRGGALERHGAALLSSRLHRLELHFGGSATKCLTDEAMTILANSLPETLERLFLGCTDCIRLTDESLAALSTRLPVLSRLRSLELRLSQNKSISDGGLVALAKALRELAALEECSIHLQGMGKKISNSGLVDIVESLALLPALRSWSIPGQNTHSVQKRLSNRGRIALSLELGRSSSTGSADAAS